jgi:hypothetical protein
LQQNGGQPVDAFHSFVRSKYGNAAQMVGVMICLRPENLFMARIGSDISDVIREAFIYLRFGIPLQNG